MEIVVVYDELDKDFVGCFYSVNDAIDCVQDKKDYYYSYLVLDIDTEKKSIYEFHINNVD